MNSKIWSAFVLVLMAPAQLAIAQDTIRIRLTNLYRVDLKLGFGSAKRWGIDSVDGTLTLQANGTWTGRVNAHVDFSQEMKGLGMNCALDRFVVSQRLDVVATTVSGFSTSSQSITNRSGIANGGFLALDVKPAAAPSRPPGPCLDMHYHDPDNPNIIPLLPLNDGRWTNPPKAGYVIGLPQRGVLEYLDGTIGCNPAQAGSGFAPCSKWTIRVERP